MATTPSTDASKEFEVSPTPTPKLLTLGQYACAAVIVVLAVFQAMVFGPYALAQTVMALIIGFYVVFVGFKFLVWGAAMRVNLWERFQDMELLTDDGLPRYFVLVPVVREEDSVGELVKAIKGLDYPTSKLHVLLLLEEFDTSTREVVARLNLPAHIEAFVVPDVGPNTKPNACNFGYQYLVENYNPSASDRLVIFDVEDRPQPRQLRFAVTAFKRLQIENPKLGCVQALLMFWNPRVSGVASFYWGEYQVHFSTVLVGLAKLKLIPPLGGTSNHFLMAALNKVAENHGTLRFKDKHGNLVSVRGPWDPFNVTEDAKVAYDLALAGYTIDMIPTVTYEEAPRGWRASTKQRSRWLQGYAYTGIEGLRRPFTSIRKIGLVRWFVFELLMCGTFLSILLNPVMWGTTALYIASRLGDLPAVTTFIEGLFPTPVYYAGMLVACFGNSFLFYQKLIMPLKRQERSESITPGTEQHPLEIRLHKEEYGLVLRLLFTPFWWAFTTIAGYRALRKLVLPSQRSTWDKTTHGHAVDDERKLAQLMGPAPSEPIFPDTERSRVEKKN